MLQPRIQGITANGISIFSSSDGITVIPEFCTAHSYCARFLRHQRARVQNIRDFPRANLDSEIKAPFLLNEHGDPHFLFYKFNENNIRNN